MSRLRTPADTFPNAVGLDRQRTKWFQRSGGNASGLSTISPPEGCHAQAEFFPPDIGVDDGLLVRELLTVVSEVRRELQDLMTPESPLEACTSSGRHSGAFPSSLGGGRQHYSLRSREHGGAVFGGQLGHQLSLIHI